MVISKASEQGTGEQTHWSGYLAMLAVHKDHRYKGLGSALVIKSIEAMRDMGCSVVYSYLVVTC